MYLTADPIRPEDFFASIGPSCGALASFLGVVRNRDEGRRVTELVYECYARMAEKKMSELVREARRRWPIEEIRLLHRTGRLKVGEIAVAITVTAAHRDASFEACRFLIERIKKDVPIWKKQVYANGESEWVACAHGYSEAVMAR